MSDNKSKAVEAKNRGNAFFSANKHADAVAAFSQAIDLDPTEHVYYSNRAASYTALGKFAEAVADAKKCIELKPDWSKGFSRLGAAHFVAKNYEEAVKAYNAGLALEPSNKEFSENLAKAQDLLAKRKQVEAAVEAAREKAAKAEEERANMKPEDKVIIGIDLGTTYSCVGVWQGDKVEIIANESGDRTTPSWVAFRPETGERLVGVAAVNQAAGNTANTLFDVKRILGQRMSESGVEADVRRFPFKVVANAEDRPMIEVEYSGAKHQLQPEQVSSMVLTKMKQIAEQYLGHPVKKAVITVPAYFNDSQRQATKMAGALANLDVVRIINEPTAAALSYGLEKKKEGANVLIFDLGGGTFDVTLLNLSGGIFQVLATAGDTHLGGEDFDHAVLEFFCKEADKLKLPNPTGNNRAMRRLKTAIERAKRQLSDSVQADIQVESLVDGADFNYTLTRAKFEALNKRLFSRCIETVQRVMKDSGLKTTDVEDVVLVGGSTRIPAVQAMLQEYFGGKELCKALNPDEAVAYGAAMQGAILSGSQHEAHKNMLLMDVTPLSLGIETVGKVMSTIIKRNTQIPCRKTQVYTTEENYQTAVDISIYEGERKTTEGNNLLGEFTISGIERAKRGEPQIEVTFDLDSNGILNVSAKDLKTNATANIEIKNRGQMSQAEINQMMEQAKKFEKEDEERLKRVELRNELEHAVTELKSVADSTTDKKLAGILSKAADAAEEWMMDHADSGSVAELQAKITELRRRTQGRNTDPLK